MLQVLRFDADGKYVEPVNLFPNDGGDYDIPADCTVKQLPQPNRKPVFQDGDWVETATEEEMNPPDTPPQTSVEEQLVQMEQDVADLWYSVMMGGLV